MAATVYATVQDVSTLWRTLTAAEQTKASAFLPIVSAALREEAARHGIDLDDEVADNADLALIAKEITVRATASAISAADQSGADVSQFSQSAMGYSVSGTFANPGGGIYFKRSELRRLGILRQRYGGIEIYDTD